ncbi:MAG: glycoside hydrolase family 38 C-terminal domain-containing protein [Promethearchaeota archaeon]
MEDNFDIFEFCRGPMARVGRYSGNERDFDEESTRDNEELPDFLEAWGDDPDSEYFDDDFEHYVNLRVESYTKLIGPGNLERMEIWCAGQSHKDLAWRWRYQQTKRKTVNTFRKAVEHWRMFPFYTFVCSQPTLLEWTRELDPALFGELKVMAASGNFDLAGGLMNECDCRIPSGEALVRQRLYGQLYYLEHFGKTADVEWMPDTFGWANTIPQILLKSGSSCFYTTKLGNNDTTPFPFSYFRWRGPDGSTLTCSYQGHQFNMLGQLGRFIHTARMVREGETLVANCESVDPANSPALGDELFPVQVFYAGAGDGKSGPMAQEVAEMRKMVEKGFLRGWCTATRHFAEAKKFENRMPVWEDELYYEFHRGTLTTQHLVKRMNRKHENDLVAVENLASVLAWGGWAGYPYGILNKAWHATLINQFHDVRPGSSIPEVYDDCYEYWSRVDRELGEVRGGLMGVLAHAAARHAISSGEGGKVVVVFNSLGTGGVLNVVEVPWGEDAGEVPSFVVGHDGRRRPVSFLPADPAEVDALDRKPDRILFRAPVPLPPLGLEAFVLSGEAPGEPPMHVPRVVERKGAVELENDKVRVVVDRGTNDVIVYRAGTAGGSAAGAGAVAWGEPVARGNLKLFHEKSKREPCWNIQPEYRQQELEIPVGEVTTQEGNGELAGVVVKRSTANSSLTLTVRLLGDAPLLFLELLCDWHEHEATLRFEWVHATGAEYGASESPYGFCRRRTRPTGPHDVGRWEMYGQSWADVSAPDGSWGLSIINEGKYGFDARDDRLGQTLIRGPEYPTPDSRWIDDERKRRFERDGTRPPTHADQGVSLIRFGLLVHEGSAPDNPVVNTVAHEFNRPFLVHLLDAGQGGTGLGGKGDEPGNSIPLSTPLVECDAPNVELSSLKRAEAGEGAFVLRFVEVGGVPETKAKLSFAPELAGRVTRIVECDLLEREGELDGAHPTWSPPTCEFTVRKCEIVSLLVEVE